MEFSNGGYKEVYKVRCDFRMLLLLAMNMCSILTRLVTSRECIMAKRLL